MDEIALPIKKSPQIRPWRYIPTLIVVGLAVTLLLPQIATLKNSWLVVQHMIWWGVALAVLSQVLSYLGAGYMLHAILREADRRGLTFQFHTGLQEGNGNVISDSNPVHLTNLFLEYGEVKFDLFHMGYPYVMELGNLAKNFRNVFIDMCWGHIISPEAARRALRRIALTGERAGTSRP